MADLVVCCDGSWSTPDDMEGGVPTTTNVVKFFNALGPMDDGGRERKYYHTGVGTEGGFFARLAGGGLGTGLQRNVKSAYKWLAATYQPGDAIWFIGHSRGAYTVRCAAAMVTKIGLLDLSGDNLGDDEIWEGVDNIFLRYREEPADRKRRKFHNQAEKSVAAPGTTPVFFIGVWDTVGSLGIPDDIAFLNLLDHPDDYHFHDTELNEHVLHARHAVAIDEDRQSFVPTLWTATEKNNDVKQVWFAGVHGDVGGGYAQTGLSDIALEWMIREAEGCGLTFANANGINPEIKDVLHVSRTGVFAKLPWRPRNMPAIDEASVDGGTLHESVLKRRDKPPLAQGAYRKHVALAAGQPVSVDIFANRQWNQTGIFLEAGIVYNFSAKGQWLDSEVKCGPGGTKDGKFFLGEIVQSAGSFFGEMEKLYKRAFHSDKADFWGSKRVEKADWFELVGVAANGAGPKEEWEQETFRIGDSCKFTPKASGYLYCFANDAWIMYGNNHGSVRLTVERK